MLAALARRRSSLLKRAFSSLPAYADEVGLDASLAAYFTPQIGNVWLTVILISPCRWHPRSLTFALHSPTSPRAATIFLCQVSASDPAVHWVLGRGIRVPSKASLCCSSVLHLAKTGLKMLHFARFCK